MRWAVLFMLAVVVLVIVTECQPDAPYVGYR